MKYWKQFWGGLNQGWKRIHYVLVPILSVLVAFMINPTEVMTITPLVALSYPILISIVYWIKEGFQSKEPTEEE